ncbi:MAG: ribonuclease R, partial [bacterium]|nr:ribonuclease R [bacterium]
MMVTEKELFEYIKKNFPRPFHPRELMRDLNVAPDDKAAIHDLVQELTRTGKLVKIRGKRLGLATAMNLVIGTLQAHPQGYGFVIPDNLQQPDVYVNGRNFGTAMHGDKVVVRIEGKNAKRCEERSDKAILGKSNGRIIRILDRAHTKLVGTFETNRYFCFVVPDEKRLFHDIYVSRKKTRGAKRGQKVVVKLLEWSSEQLNPEGEITDILGYPDEPGVDIQSIIEKYNLPSVFPATVLHEAELIAEQEKDLVNRLDLRDLLTITIDPEDAKDLDDAVSLERTETGYRLGVHIADVSYYVAEGTALDNEARLRGNSVYLVDRVLPMLPPQLSNGSCSLNPQEDRLTLSCIMDFDNEGNQVGSKIVDSIIKTSARLTYDQVKRIIVEKEKEIRITYQRLVPLLEEMETLARKLYAKRQQQGSIDFNLPETKVFLDDKGKVIEIRKIEKDISHQLIEEFMLAANKTVATQMSLLLMPSIYRVHQPPDRDAMLEFQTFIKPFGYKMKVTDPMPSKEVQRLLNTITGKPEEILINQVLLREMKEARYAVENIGHFGLAFPFYTHFTSPIRRYPDLIVHRLLRKLNFVKIHCARSEATRDKRTLLREEQPIYQQLNHIAVHSSETERTAMEAERESVLVKKIEFLRAQVGEEYYGIISGVTAYGLFVELEEFLIEGLIHISTLDDDYYHFYEEQYAIKGEHTSRRFRLGDRVKVRVMKVDLQKKEIDL